MLKLNEFDDLPHIFEWSALIDSSRRNSYTKELKDYAESYITVEKPQRRTLFFMVF